MVESLVVFFKWPRHLIHLRTGKHDADMFERGSTAISVITYGLLWRWLTGHDDACDSAVADHGFILRRYAGIFFDEFADLSPKSEEACRMVGKLVQGRLLWNGIRLVVAGYAIQGKYVRDILGDHLYVVVNGRKHTMERCVVSPEMEHVDILRVAADLALVAIARNDDRKGDVIVFLPGLHEMLRVQVMLRKALPSLTVWLLHSDTLGNEDETDIDLPDLDNERVVALSTIIGARTITFDKMRYAIVHPAVRVEVLHASGISCLCDEALSSELEGNMRGRVARLSSGLATMLYHTDDTALAISQMHKVIRPQAMNADTNMATLVVGSPSRFYCVQHTCRHLRSRGFQNVYWLRTPDPSELDPLNDDPKKRVMMFWYTTVLPALLVLENTKSISRAFVVEDTCLLAPGIVFDDVERATRDTRASLFGYGRFDDGPRGPQWHGTKGLCVTAAWCHSLAIVLENMRPQDFEHFDLWLKKRKKNIRSLASI
jgi:hypothetical protein